MSIRKRLKSGFTLVELMIVVAIIGILAVLAVYGVKKYMANSKTAEARQSLGRIGKDATSAYENEHMSGTLISEGSATAVTRQLCDTASAKVPAAMTEVTAKKYQSSAAEWKVDGTAAGVLPKGFACLRFELATPQYYQYEYTAAAYSATNGSFNAFARGDLDGNGTTSVFELDGKVQSSRLTLAPQLIETEADE